MPVPGVAVAGGFCEFCGSEIADGQMQGDHTVAIVHILECLHVITRRGVSLPVPGIGFTCCHAEFNMRTLVDGQMQRDGAVAAMNGLELLCVAARRGVGFIVPCITVTSRCGPFCGFGGIDREV